MEKIHDWTWIIILIIAVVAVVKVITLIRHNNNLNRSLTNGNQRIISANITTAPRNEITETGPMIYYANDHHGRNDKEYHFNYKKVGGSWRAYILRMPSLNNRDTSGVVTHRLHDNEGSYVCWDCSVNSLKDMQTISKVWADNIQEYIATGKRFG